MGCKLSVFIGSRISPYAVSLIRDGSGYDLRLVGGVIVKCGPMSGDGEASLGLPVWEALLVQKFGFPVEQPQRAFHGYERHWRHVPQNEAVEAGEPRAVTVIDAVDDFGCADDAAALVPAIAELGNPAPTFIWEVFFN